MTTELDFHDIDPQLAAVVPTAAQVIAGIPVPPMKLLQVMSAEDWEVFTHEWLSFHRGQGTYHSIQRSTGAGDLGLDVVAFATPAGFAEPWDSYQCKHYDHALQPNDVLGEIAKIIYHSFMKTPPFNQACRTPRRHVFVAPKGTGLKLSRLLRDPARFKAHVREHWDSHCVPKLGKNVSAPLKGELLDYFDGFDFAVFEDRSGVQLIEEHAQTVFYAARFGGGLPPRGAAKTPPEKPEASESRYLKKLLDAYGDHLGVPVAVEGDLDTRRTLHNHYNRQRLLFYSAESLRNFARDRTPPMTFDSLQDDVYHGVIDICESVHSNGLERLRATISTAANVDVSGNALVSVTRVSDKQGICHQLANDDRLTWIPDDD